MRKEDRDRQQAREIEENQASLKRSIAETSQLVHESEAMLQRHRREREEDESENRD